MSRRKQSKPQHVEFRDNKNVLLADEMLPDATSTTKVFSRVKSFDRGDSSRLACGLNSHQEPSGCTIAEDSVATEGTDPNFSHSAHLQSSPIQNDIAIMPVSARESVGRRENPGFYHEPSAESEPSERGQVFPSYRSMLHPKYNGSCVPQKQQEAGMKNGSSPELIRKLSEVNGDSSGTQRDSETFPTANLEEQRMSELDEDSEESHACGRCGACFDLARDFMRHEKFGCMNALPPLDVATDRHLESESRNIRGDLASAVSSNYVVSGNVIMANGEDLLAGRDERRSDGGATSPLEDDRELNVDESGRISPEASKKEKVGIEKYADDRSPTPDSTTGSDGLSQKMEGPFVPRAREIDNISEERDRSSEDNENGEADVIQIRAKEAMAQAFQNMAALASRNNDKKPELGAIKYQVRMIQQQQAYQVHMLNFLKWQLALASSNPPATVAASAATNGFVALNSAAQSSILGPNGGLPGSAFMPQMMAAAMAVNNFQNGPTENMAMAELAKARLTMGAQQAADGNYQNLRDMFAGSIGEQEDTRHRNCQPEQRYQIKVADDVDVAEDVPDPSKAHHDPEREKSRAKSDSDEDIRLATSAADDESSSHGSQEDGELRDNALSSTAEEQRHCCRFCRKVFGSDSALQIHIRSHTGERPFKCNICGNRFTTKGNLKVHFARHKSKYPHIPMNNHPVPEYLDRVPTSNGVPYGMSILPEKAVLERPRLHGNPSIHLTPQQSAALGQLDASQVTHTPFSSLFFPPHNAAKGNDFHSEWADIQNRNGPVDAATAIQAQLLQRRRAEFLQSQRSAEDAKQSLQFDDASNGAADPKNHMSLLQAAMLPFLPGIAARQQLENMPPQLQYLLPHHLKAVQTQNGVNGITEGNGHFNNAANVRLPTLPQSIVGSPVRNRKHEFASKMAASVSSSETTKLQRLVENIDRGRVLQKNECHMCHRILSCQSALKLHYRTHTGERPYKCDLCSRAFTTRGNLRTHYSSVHRQQMPPLPPGGKRSSSQAEAFSRTLCPSGLKDTVEYQRHMQMHAAMVQAQQQQRRMLELERESRSVSPPNAVDSSSRPRDNGPPDSTERNNDHVKSAASLTSSVEMDTATSKRDSRDSRDPGEEENRPSSARSTGNGAFVKLDRDEDASPKKESVQTSHDDEAPRESNGGASTRSSTSPSAAPSPLDSLAALSNIGPGADAPLHTGAMLDHQLAALNRARAGRLTVCEICDESFSCQSALEIHLRSHTKERPFVCQTCERAFATKGNLKQHLSTHDINDIPEQMPLPVSSSKNGDSDSASPSLSSSAPNESQSSVPHKRSAESADLTEPSAKRSYPRHWCHICQKQFSSASSLQIHNRTHTGERPFSCNVCGRAFTTKGNLKVHMGTHVWGAGGSRRGRRISMDNPLISPWMKNMTRPGPAQPLMPLPSSSSHVPDAAAALYHQYAAIASGFLGANQEAAASRFLLPIANGQAGNTATSPVSSGGSPHPTGEMTTSQAGANGSNLAANPASAATEWFLKAYQRTQEQVN